MRITVSHLFPCRQPNSHNALCLSKYSTTKHDTLSLKRVSLPNRKAFTPAEKFISRAEMYISRAEIQIPRAEIYISRREMNFSPRLILLFLTRNSSFLHDSIHFLIRLITNKKNKRGTLQHKKMNKFISFYSSFALSL